MATYPNSRTVQNPRSSPAPRSKHSSPHDAHDCAMDGGLVLSNGDGCAPSPASMTARHAGAGHRAAHRLIPVGVLATGAGKRRPGELCGGDNEGTFITS